MAILSETQVQIYYIWKWYVEANSNDPFLSEKLLHIC